MSGSNLWAPRVQLNTPLFYDMQINYFSLVNFIREISGVADANFCMYF